MPIAYSKECGIPTPLELRGDLKGSVACRLSHGRHAANNVAVTDACPSTSMLEELHVRSMTWLTGLTTLLIAPAVHAD